MRLHLLLALLLPAALAGSCTLDAGDLLDDADLRVEVANLAACADTVRLLLVQAARRHMDKHLKSVYSLPQLSRMAPGSLQDWPLPEQAPLFRLLGDTESLIGVRLTDRHLMIPIKSVSGICFPTEVRFESCQLCQRPVCIGRRAPYNPELATRYGVAR